MGAWSVTGNDTAQDLRYEYKVAFYYYDVPEALNKIDKFVREKIADEGDAEEWCSYVYSLADFMWKKGILTEEIKTANKGYICSYIRSITDEKFHALDGKYIIAQKINCFSS